MATPGRERGGGVLGGEHARPHGVMGALDAWHVEEAGAVADQGAAGESEIGHRLPAALGDGAGAIADALAAREGIAHQWMGLEALEFLEWRQIGVLVVE